MPRIAPIVGAALLAGLAGGVLFDARPIAARVSETWTAYIPFVVKQPDCREMFVNGGFDNGLEGWSSNDRPKLGEVPAVSILEFRGNRSLTIHPRSGRAAVRVTSSHIPQIDRGRMESARLRFSYSKAGSDPVPFSDSMQIWLSSVGGRSCREPCISLLAELRNQDPALRFTRDMDVANEVGDPEWGGVYISIVARNDVTDDTLWSVDDFSLVVCFREPFPNATPQATQPRLPTPVFIPTTTLTPTATRTRVFWPTRTTTPPTPTPTPTPRPIIRPTRS